MNARNKQAVRAYVEAFNALDVPRLEQLFAADARIWGVLGSGPLDTAIGIWRELHEGLEARLEILDIAAENDDVVLRLRESGRFVGPFRGLAGIEPTGKPFEIVAIEWFKVHDGKIAERWGARDSAAIARQVAG